MSWHRTHRPKAVKELHLSNIRDTLLGFMKRGQIPQVMLFAGPKGTGKTSSARIIGAILNDPKNNQVIDHQFFKGSKPKNNQYSEPNIKSNFNDRIYRGQSFIVQEMDAASNRGIDDVRDLKERIALPPQDGKMTVYILDEAHMLTTAAFNALLKILEEPPAHAVFILATTELHKIPDTIKSRCSLLNFRKANHEEIKKSLTNVLTKENIKYDEKAIDSISLLADGSFRDAVKLLEMVATDGQVTSKKVELILSSSITSDVANLLTYVLDKDEQSVSKLFEDLRSRNVDEKFFYKATLNYLHTCLLQNLEIKPGEPFTSQTISLFILKELSQIVFTPAPIAHLHLELKILDLIARSGGKKKANPPVKKNPEPLKKEAPNSKKSAAPEITGKEEVILEVTEEDGPAGDSQKLLANWPALLEAVKSKNVTIEALLRSAKPLKGINGTAQVEVFYQFHKEQLELPKFKTLITDCAKSIAGGRVKINYQLATTPTQVNSISNALDDDLATMAEELLV